MKTFGATDQGDRKPEPVPVPGVDVGDRVFFSHQGEPHVGSVICHGKHGCTVDHEGTQRKVRWEHVLGHHTRAEREYKVVEKGEAGAIVHDGRRRRFVDGEIPEPKPDQPSDRDVARVQKMVGDAIRPMYKSECCDHDDDDLLAKAAGDGPGDIWEPHHSPIVRQMIELFTERGLLRSGSMQDELDAWLAGERYNPAAKRTVPPGYLDRWSASELKLVRMYLEAIPPNEFTVDDWMLVIDYLAQTYFPHSELVAEADWLASRAVVMGKVQAGMDKVTAAQSDALLAAIPSTATVGVQLGLSTIDRAIIKLGAVRCAEAVVSVVGSHKQALKQTILEYQQAALFGTKPAESLQTRLFDRFAVLNADWRRIAVTETAEISNQGTIAALKPGARVRRLEQYKAACGFCRKIDGMEFDVVASDAPDKDGWKQVWVGKTNIGRSAAPRKRTADGLVERTDAELWWPAAGTMHPHCRGMWLPVVRPPSAGDDKFTAWMAATLSTDSQKSI